MKAINYPQFLKMIETQIEKIPVENLAAFVREIARTWPEDERRNFLDLLQRFASDRVLKNNDEGEDLKIEIDRLTDFFSDIENQALWFESDYNEEYAEWENESEPYVIQDPDGILKVIEDAMIFVHRCVDMEKYAEGYKIANHLACMTVAVSGPAAEYEEGSIAIDTLDAYELLNRDYEDFCMDCLLTAYLGNSTEDRAGALYCMFHDLKCTNITLKSILKNSTMNLPDFDDFLPDWIEYLGDFREILSIELLKEALSLIRDDTVQLKYARAYIEAYPELIKEYLMRHQNTGEDAEMLEIGIEAIEKLPEDLTIRSDLALLTADFACKTGKTELAENCWMTAFRSNTIPVHYFRMRFLSGNWEKIHDVVSHYYEALYQTKKLSYAKYSDYAGSRNRLSTEYYCVLSYFDGEFDRMRETGMKTQSPLGWSSTFNKEGIALMLLLINQNAALTAALQNMMLRARRASGFSRALFESGTGKNSDRTDDALFIQLFDQWKSTVTLSQEDIQNWMSWIERLLKFRTEGIMEANRRNYYGECAVFIAAYGDVKESLGCEGAKQAVMAEYKNRYGRRKNFMAELVHYGMKKENVQNKEILPVENQISLSFMTESGTMEK